MAQQKKKSEIKSEVTEGVRLNVLLQKYGFASRRKADDLIASGAVKVNGKKVTELGTRFSPECKITVNGKAVKTAPSKVVYLFHKPVLTITSRKDEMKQRQTIFDLPALKGLPANVQSVGRLDYRSEGLLILTNDGSLALTLTHPKYSVKKTYAVLVSSEVSSEDISALRKGIPLEDGLARALAVKLGDKEKMGNSLGQWLELVVAEGRNRLIRRMMEALGLNVVRLVRISVGLIRLPQKLLPGQIRVITEKEKTYLESLIKQDPAVLKSKKEAVPPTPEELAVRKSKRKMRLNDDEYAREAERRDMRAVQKIKERKGRAE